MTTAGGGAGELLDAPSVLAVVPLGAQHGDEVTRTPEGEGTEPVLDEPAQLLGTDLAA
ncbi:MAG: HPr family phosphocarrier protein [Georgenia sp.]